MTVSFSLGGSSSFADSFFLSVSFSANGLVGIVHTHNDARGLELHHSVTLRSRTISRSEDNLELARLVKNKVSGLVLITVAMTTDNNRLIPSRNETRDLIR